MPSLNKFDLAQILFFLAALSALSPLLGAYMAKIFAGDIPKAFRWLRPLESLAYAAGGIAKHKNMNWKAYAGALLGLHIVGFLFLLVIQLAQAMLPLNPQGLPGVPWHLALNTAISFVTNTNWQSYAGETTLSYFNQMVGLTVQNFLSAATGMAVLVALARGFAARQTPELGNFWVDLTRATLYILLPLSILLSIALVSQGVVQNFSAYLEGTTLEGAKQTLAMGPAASQIAIKQLGTNGGGFFNANSAHPFENPSALSNFLELLSIVLIPSALCFTFGRLIRDRRQGLVLWGCMLGLFLVSLAGALAAESGTLGAVPSLMEGKETRFGVMNSVLWSTVTTVASNGSVNAMHSSLSPLAGGLAMLNMMLGEVIFGGVGSGLYGMLHFAILTVFLAGLMVGRTPEYLGKKIEAPEIQMTIVALLAPSVCVLLGTAAALSLPAGLSSLSAKGPHGLSEALYAFTSAANNNGSAFAGLNANVPFYNVLLGLSMLVGRFAVILPTLAVAGSLAAKKLTPPSPGTFRTDSGLFVMLLAAVVLIVGGLTFFPALALGPIAEHFLLLQGRTF
ncbi:MAG: potassium-transporting ATPase subunit KdpA [Proteobacteria bacterium]|nr:MAG: potassium-transporting ATPase subunit KdpA [Pseudomonadota bacterium]